MAGQARVEDPVELCHMFKNNLARLVERVDVLVGDRPRDLALIAGLVAHQIVADTILFRHPHLNGTRFDSIVFRQNTLVYSAYDYPGRPAWVLSTHVADNQIVYVCNTVGGKSYEVVMHADSLFCSRDLANLAACIDSTGVVVLAIVLSYCVAADMEGVFTIRG